jgi:hypothetical protein
MVIGRVGHSSARTAAGTATVIAVAALAITRSLRVIDMVSSSGFGPVRPADFVFGVSVEL